MNMLGKPIYSNDWLDAPRRATGEFRIGTHIEWQVYTKNRSYIAYVCSGRAKHEARIATNILLKETK